MFPFNYHRDVYNLITEWMVQIIKKHVCNCCVSFMLAGQGDEDEGGMGVRRGGAMGICPPPWEIEINYTENTK